LLEFLKESVAFVSLKSIKKQLSLGEVKVNLKREKEDILLKEGDEVEIYLPKSSFENAQMPRVVYQDENILAIDKPVLCDVENHLVALFSEKHDYLMPVHRLDVNTTGLVLFALNEKTHDEMLKAFKEKKIKKVYEAKVFGHLKHNQATLKAYLKKDDKNSFVTISDMKKNDNKEIITEYEVVEKFEENGEKMTKLKLFPITGRTHQLRAHLAYAGHPILGDMKYGDFDKNKRLNQRYQSLRAKEVSFSGMENFLKYLNKLLISV